MSSAIEVLKEFKNNPDIFIGGIKRTVVGKDLENAIDEALLTLQQKKKYDNVGFCCDNCGAETASCLTLCPDCLEKEKENRKQGALEEIELLEVFNAKNFMNKPYVKIKKYCEERLKELEGVEK